MNFEFLATVPFWICLLFALTDAIRDKMKGGAYKWPNSGWRILRRGMFIKTVRTKGANAEAEINGWRLVVTVDFWHVNKWLSLYSAGAFVWWHVPTIEGKIVTVIFAWALWRLIPKPVHWR